MAARDIYEAIAAIAIPLPDAESFAEANSHLVGSDLQFVFNEAQTQAMEARQRRVAELRVLVASAAEHDQEVDPLLDTLVDFQGQIAHLERQTTLLIAYAREYVRPQPYQLKDLAHAAGMSISGVRIAYDEDDVREVGELTGDKPRRPQSAAT